MHAICTVSDNICQASAPSHFHSIYSRRTIRRFSNRRMNAFDMHQRFIEFQWSSKTFIDIFGMLSMCLLSSSSSFFSTVCECAVVAKNICISIGSEWKWSGGKKKFVDCCEWCGVQRGIATIKTTNRPTQYGTTDHQCLCERSAYNMMMSMDVVYFNTAHRAANWCLKIWKGPSSNW